MEKKNEEEEKKKALRLIGKGKEKNFILLSSLLAPRQ